MNKRILVPLGLLVLAALALTACGGSGSSAEAKITETIEKATTTSDPSNCTELETLRFVEQNTTEKGQAALRTCESEAESNKGKAKSATVSNISVDGEKATAQAAFEGGPLDSQTLELAMAEEEGTWKVDHVEGFAKYDGKALGEAFERKFEEEEPQELEPEQAKCIGGKIAELSQTEAEEVIFGGSAEKIIKLAQSCA